MKGRPPKNWYPQVPGSLLEDESAHWEFVLLGQRRPERFVVVDEGETVIAIWLDHDALVSGDAYRLDFFKVRPDLQRHGLGGYLLGLVGIRARELQARRLVFQPASQGSERFFRHPKIGAVSAEDWRGRESLPNLQLLEEKLTLLVDRLNARKIVRAE